MLKARQEFITEIFKASHLMIFQREELNGSPMVNSMLQARFHFWPVF